MTIQIIVDNGTYDLLNLGDVAMLQVAVLRLRCLWPQADIHVITNAPERLARYCPQARPIPSFWRSPWLLPWNVLGALHRLMPSSTHQRLQDLETYARMTRPDLVRRWVNFRLSQRCENLKEMNTFLDLLRDADLVIATGGGFITDSFELHGANVLETLRTARSKGAIAALVGQGLGPVTTPGLRTMMKRTLPAFDFIALREGRTGVNLLAKFGVSDSRVMITGDDAIELAYQATPKELGDAIGVNVRLASYSEIDSSDIDKIRRLVTDAATCRNVSVLSVPISMYPTESDSRVFQQLMGTSPDGHSEDIDSPERVIQQVGRCRIVITGSYHAGVFALSQGISVVGLVKSAYYRDKFLGLADQFGTGCHVVDLGHHDFSGRMAAAINQAWAEAPQVRAQLLDAAVRQTEVGQTAYKRLYSIVTGERAA